MRRVDESVIEQAHAIDQHGKGGALLMKGLNDPRGFGCSKPDVVHERDLEKEKNLVEPVTVV